jgi:uncharacterized repeat protein (TIGR03803 family)
VLSLLVAAALAPRAAALGPELTTLYNFCSESGCADGAIPYVGLVARANTFYRTTSEGGAHNQGTVYSLTRKPKAIAFTETVLYSFCSTGVAGLNDVLNRPSISGFCGTCHDTPNAGDHSVKAPLNISVANAGAQSPPVLDISGLLKAILLSTAKSQVGSAAIPHLIRLSSLPDRRMTEIAERSGARDRGCGRDAGGSRKCRCGSCPQGRAEPAAEQGQTGCRRTMAQKDRRLAWQRHPPLCDVLKISAQTEA